MWHTFRCLLVLFALLVSDAQGEATCKNFLVQQCIDIPFEFDSISTIKCIQLIPTQYYTLTEYSVQNYIVKKGTTHYDIVPYNSSSPALFSNTDTELCPEQYCRLFDNQPNTTIINVFYSPTFSYDETKSGTNNMRSYDYFLFNPCPASSRGSRTLLIVVYTLAGFIGFMTIAVILRCILRSVCAGGRPWDWRWVRDLICCRFDRLCRNPDPQGRPDNERGWQSSPGSVPNRLYFIDNDHQPHFRNNRPPFGNPRATYSVPFRMSTSNPRYPVQAQNNPPAESNENGGYPSSLDFLSERTLSTHGIAGSGIHHLDDQDLSNRSSLGEAVTHHQAPLFAALARLSSKASSALSGTFSTHGYGSLGERSSREYPILRL